MSTTFRSHTFLAGGENVQSFPTWARKARTAVLDLPGANNDVVQTFGRKSDTMSLQVNVTASELSALMGDVGSTGTLVLAFGSYTAYLDSIDGVAKYYGLDLYTASLSFIRQ